MSIIDAHTHNRNPNEALGSMKKSNSAFPEKLDAYSRKYQLPQQ